MKKPRIAITTGDLNGVGLEVALKTMSDARILNIATPIIYGTSKIIAIYRKKAHLPELKIKIINNTQEASTKHINIIEAVDLTPKIELGKKSVDTAMFALKSLEAAASAARNRDVEAIITSPVDKHTLSEALNIPFVGQTEFLQKFSNSGQSLMVFLSENLKLALATNHLSIKEVAAAITKPHIISKIKAVASFLRKDFALQRPKIAVLGLNPHAGDNGLLGLEESTEISLAIKTCKEERLIVEGPFGADSFFTNKDYKYFDATLAMYHDQGLIPFKLLADDKGVNFTAGLDFVRTSPVHGVAYDIAGKKCAHVSSFREALYKAIDIYRTRSHYMELTSNQLGSKTITENQEILEESDLNIDEAN